MNDFLNKNKIKLMILALSVVMLITSASYAWFSATVSGNPTNNNVVTSGVMEITYVDGQLIGTPTNFLPGQEIVKYFTVRNTGNVDTEYVIYLSEVNNNFNPTTDLEYKLEKLSTNGYEKVFTPCPTAPSAINSVAIPLEDNDTHEYKLTIKFKETGSNQDSNQGKKFSARLSINEYKKAIIAVNFNARGGVSSRASDSIESESTLETLPTVTRAQDDDYSYTFNGWYDAETGGNQVTTSTEFIADTTIYAHYILHQRNCVVSQTSTYYNNDWTATYNCHDGTGTITTCAYKGTTCTGNGSSALYGGYYINTDIVGCVHSSDVWLDWCDSSLGHNYVSPGRMGTWPSGDISCSCPDIIE